MNMRPLMLISGFAAAAIICLAGSARPPASISSPAPTPAAPTFAAQQPDLFEIDPVHSNTFFRIRHLGVSNFYGRFNTTAGEYRFDPKRPEDIAISVTIPAASVDSHNASRNNHIKSPDFFDVKEFENISFTSTKATRKSGNVFAITGDLTLHGVTKSITAEVEWIGEGERGRRFGYRSGFEARFSVKRSDYGMDLYVKEGMLGDEITIIAAIEGQRKVPSPAP